MKKHNLHALRKSDISPHIVIQELDRNAEKFEEICAVAIGKDGEPYIFATGDAAQISYAALALQEIAQRFISYQIE